MSKGELKVTTYLVCAPIRCLGQDLGHILANTRYEVREQEKRSVSHSDERESGPVMFIVDSNLQDALEPTGIAALKEQHVGARVVVILADAFDLDQMMAALNAGADGYCLPTVDALIRYLDLVMLGEMAYPSAHFLAGYRRGAGPRHRR